MNLHILQNKHSRRMEKHPFTPFQLGPYELPNRIVMAPLTRSRAGAGNVPQAINVKYYAQRAAAGFPTR